MILRLPTNSRDSSSDSSDSSSDSSDSSSGAKAPEQASRKRRIRHRSERACQASILISVDRANCSNLQTASPALQFCAKLNIPLK